MKKQGPGNRDQATEIRDQGSGISPCVELPIEELLKRAVPPADAGAGPGRDLWPVLAARIRAEEAERVASVACRVPWYDWALAAGLLVFVGAAPVSIPVLLYYL